MRFGWFLLLFSVSAFGEPFVSHFGTPGNTAASSPLFSSLGFKILGGEKEGAGELQVLPENIEVLKAVAGQVQIVARNGTSGRMLLYVEKKGDSIGCVTVEPGENKWSTDLASLLTTYIGSLTNKGALSTAEITESTKKWRDEHVNVAKLSLEGKRGGLSDFTRFLSPQGEGLLKQFQNSEQIIDGKKVKLIPTTENGFKFAVQVGEGKAAETWYLSEPDWFTDQFDKGLPGGTVHFIVRKKGPDGKVDPQTQAAFHAEDAFDPAAVHAPFIEAWRKDGRYQQFVEKLEQTRDNAIYKFHESVPEGTRVNLRAVLEQIENAKDYFKREEADPTRIQTWDLPKDKKIGYVGLIDGNPKHDPIADGMIDSVREFPRYMNSLGYQFSTIGHSESLNPRDNPELILEDRLREFKKQGIKDVFLKLSGHGNENGIVFRYTQDGKTKRVYLKADALRKLFDEFPDMNFTIHTTACHGGMLASMMKDYHDSALPPRDGRIRVFLETKENTFAQEGRLAETPGLNPQSPKIFSSYYDVALVYYLNQGLPFGMAHYRADKFVKRFIASDSETWMSTPHGGEATTKIYAKNDGDTQVVAGPGRKTDPGL